MFITILILMNTLKTEHNILLRYKIIAYSIDFIHEKLFNG